MVTPVKGFLVSLDSGRSQEDKNSDFISVLDYGAAVGASVTVNSAAINTALLEAAVSGFVVVPVGVAYTESLLVIPTGVTLLVFGAYGTLTVLVKDFGAQAIARGGICVKSQGHTGVLLRAVDNGVATDPLLQLVDAASGDVAAANMRFLELDEIAAPATPGLSKGRLYIKDDGSDNSLLMAQFATGDAVQLAKQGDGPSLTGTVSFDPASLATGAVTTTTVTVTGATTGDLVVVSFSIPLGGLHLCGWVSAADTVTVSFHNPTAGAIDLGNGTITAKVLRSRL